MAVPGVEGQLATWSIAQLPEVGYLTDENFNFDTVCGTATTTHSVQIPSVPPGLDNEVPGSRHERVGT